MSTISEAEFRRLCDDVYLDRRQIHAFNPNASEEEAVLWMLAGCLISLLDVPLWEQPSGRGGTSAGAYREAIHGLLQSRMEPIFDSRTPLIELSEKIAAGERENLAR